MCDQVNQVVAVQQMDDIDEMHQPDPVRQVDDKISWRAMAMGTAMACCWQAMAMAVAMAMSMAVAVAMSIVDQSRPWQS